MPETPDQLWKRAKNALRTPPVEEWDTFPFDGEIRPRALRGPEQEPARHGQGGVDCHACEAGDDEYLWTNDRWRLRTFDKPTGLPVVVLLEPRAHYAEPGDLTDDLAAELGRMLARMERAVRAVPNVGRVHVCRWGDGGEHLHWWFMARPTNFPQLIGSFAAVWDEILPPLPDDVWRENLAIVTRELAR